mgnify:CR=1 FL=1
MRNERDIRKKQDWISILLWVFYCVFLVLSVVIIGKIVKIQYRWEPDAEYVRYFQPKHELVITKPERGAILDHNGKLLAISTPMYNINMDCTVRKEEFAKIKDTRKRDSLENDWKRKPRLLSRELPKVLVKDGKINIIPEQNTLLAQDKIEIKNLNVQSSQNLFAQVASAEISLARITIVCCVLIVNSFS